jgi:hypothetical protein
VIIIGLTLILWVKKIINYNNENAKKRQTLFNYNCGNIFLSINQIVALKLPSIKMPFLNSGTFLRSSQDAKILRKVQMTTY